MEDVAPNSDCVDLTIIRRARLMKNVLLSLTGGEFGLIAEMDMDHSGQFLALQDAPTSPCQWCAVRTVAAFPGEFDSRLHLSHSCTVVHGALNVTELEVTVAPGSELKVAFDFLVHIFLVPLPHPGDPPPALKFVLSFRLLFLYQDGSGHS